MIDIETITYYVQEYDANDEPLSEPIECPTNTEAHGIAALQSREFPNTIWVVNCETDGVLNIIGIYST